MTMGGGSDKPKDTPEQRNLAAVAAEKWNYSQKNLAPLQNQYMEYVDQMDSTQNKDYIRGRTLQGQNQAHGGASEELHKGLATGGIDPSSGRYQGAMNDMSTDMGVSGGENLGRALFEQDGQKIMGLQNIVAMGDGQATKAQSGMSGLAQQSVSNNISNAKNSFNRRSANLQLVGNVAGAATAYGMNGGGGGGAPGASPNDYTSPEFNAWAGNQ